MKRILLFALLLTTLSASAYDFMSGGIAYNITSSTDKTVEVTYINSDWYSSYSGSVSVPNSVTYNNTTYKVTKIGKYAFSYSTDLTDVSLTSSIKVIGNGAFLGCTRLPSIVIPYSVDTIGNDAFWSCYDLAVVSIYGSLWHIGDYAFQHCRSLVCLRAMDRINSIGSKAFDDCDALRYIRIGGLTPPQMSGYSVFTETANSQATLNVPQGCLSDYQTAACWSYFTNIVEHDSYDYDFARNGIYYNFTGANSLEVTFLNSGYEGGNSYSGDVGVPSTVTYSGKTFNVTSIGREAFCDCTGLTSISIPASVTSIGNFAFNNCTSLTSVALPSVNTIGRYGFALCENLTSVTLSNALTSIGEYAFWLCGLTSVTIPSSVTSIDSDAFCRCDNMNSVTCLAATPPSMGTSVFYQLYNDDRKLFVPKASLNAYRNASGWSNFNEYRPTLNYALNTGNAAIEFTSTGNYPSSYPWTNMYDGDRIYAFSGNKGVHSSTSTMSATVTVGSGATLSFEFKAWGEGTSYDKCIFSIDGTQKFSYGARQNDWEAYSVQLSAGTHTLTWTYSKDSSVHPTGDYFAVDNVRIVGSGLRGDVDGNGVVGMDDLTALINYLVYGTTVNMTGADTDMNGVVGMDDLTALINYLVFGQWPSSLL